jgi:hypothetical protein
MTAQRLLMAPASLRPALVTPAGEEPAGAGGRSRDGSLAGGEKQLGLLSAARSEHLLGRLATLAAEDELCDVGEPDDPSS